MIPFFRTYRFLGVTIVSLLMLLSLFAPATACSVEVCDGVYAAADRVGCGDVCGIDDGCKDPERLNPIADSPIADSPATADGDHADDLCDGGCLCCSVAAFQQMIPITADLPVVVSAASIFVPACSSTGNPLPSDRPPC